MNNLEWAIIVAWVIIFHRIAYELVVGIIKKRNRSKNSVSKTVTRSNTKDW